MGRITQAQRERAREAVRKYLERHGSGSLRDIADFVQSRTGALPGLGTVAKILRELGYERGGGWKKL